MNTTTIIGIVIIVVVFVMIILLALLYKAYLNLTQAVGSKPKTIIGEIGKSISKPKN